MAQSFTNNYIGLRSFPSVQRTAWQRLVLPSTRKFSLTPTTFDKTPSGRIPPDQKAANIISSVPSTSLLTKSGVLTVTAAALATAISKGIYVVNDESIVVASFLGLVGVFGTLGRKAYNEWSDKTIAKIGGIMQAARNDHTSAIRERIDQVASLQEVESVTQALFHTSKETARMEAEIFELEQRVALAKEAKSVLDSWVHHEANVRAEQQERLVEDVLARVNSKVSTQKFQQDALNESLGEIEKVLASA